MKFAKSVRVGRVSGGWDKSHWNRNDVPNFQGATPVIVSVENRKVCNKTTMKKSLEGFGEVLIIDKTDGFRLDLSRRQRKDLGAPLQTWE